jgi:NADPH:quinone reductase
MKTKQIVLASRPEGLPTLRNFRFEEVFLPSIKNGEVLLKGMFYSVDPYMRGRMNDTKSYAEPFQIDQPIMGAVVALVAESKSEMFKIGEMIVGLLPWCEIFIANEKDIHKIDVSTIRPSYYLGILGMPGLTAYFGLMRIGKPKGGETVVVSGAAGAVGVIVGQIAKIFGCHVVGIAGTDEKVKTLKEEFGFDEAINYKTTHDMNKAIADACPKGVDVYFDNVGGEISDAVINNINFHGRIALCGQIALYNATNVPMGPRIQPMLLTRSVLMQGFIIGNFQSLFLEGTQQLSEWIADGKLKYTETVEHGFDNLPRALLGLFSGENTGKMVVEA